MPSLMEKLVKAEAIPSPPGVALEIVRLNRDEDVDIERLAAVVERDPAIVAKLLKMANSASFGRPGQISDIHQAIVTLGLRSVNMLALSFSVVAVASGKSRADFDYPRFWTATGVTATAARVLAGRFQPRLKDEAFLAGLLANFAQLVIAEAAPREYAKVVTAVGRRGEPLLEAERRIYGDDHAAIGEKLLRSWGLPERVARAVGAHHDPDAAGEDDGPVRDLARIVCVADSWGELYSAGEVARDARRLIEVAEQHLGADVDALQELLRTVDEAVPEMMELLAFEAVDPVALAEVRVQATEQLVRESLALNQQIGAVASSVERLQSEKQALEEKATTDPLTGLRNRGFFDETLAGELERAAQDGHPLGLLILDIDHFKSVNDTYGHRAGDELLRAVAAAIAGEATAEETVCRYGGEEMAVIAPGTTPEKLRERAERLRAVIAETSIESAGERVARTVSVGGCAVLGVSGPEIAPALIEKADAELYRAKSGGRNRCHVVALDAGR